MPLTTGQQVLDAVAGMLPASSDSVNTSIKWWLGIRKHIIHVKDAIDGAAGDTTTIMLGVIPAQFRVVSVTFTSATAGLTAHDTNYATLSLEYDDAAGGADTVVASQTTKITGGSGNWTATVPVSITLTAANVVVAANKQLIFKIAKAASGVAVPAGLLTVLIEPA